MNRRKFLQASAGAGALAPQALTAATASGAPLPAADIASADITTLQSALQSGAHTAASLVQALWARADAIDQAGPALRSIIERNPDAPAIAESLDRERRERGPRGPLHGIPVLLKDNIDTADRMRTSAGSLALAESVALRDAFVVERLRAAGCVVLGKTNLSEWANFRGMRSTSGWSARGGLTRNPHALDRNTSGSSSGSAAAVAAGLCPVAVGTETDGSIVSPASCCGIVGIKPTLGLVSRSGIVPIAHSQDTAGPMARSVADAAALLGAMTGADPRDKATRAARDHAHTDYTRFLDRAGLRGARLGIAREFFGTNDRVDRLIDEAIAAMKKAGAVIVDPVPVLSDRNALGEAELEVLLYEYKADLNAYLAGTAPSVATRTLADVIRFNEAQAGTELRHFGQEHMVHAQTKGPLTRVAYRRALATCRRLARDQGIDAAVGKHRLDAIVAPTGGPAWLTDFINGDHETGSCSQPAAVAGYPHITVPAGFVSGLPVGLSFFGPAWSEPTLIRLAYAFEQATRAWRAPGFAASATA